jgi:hypothetical protein
VKTRSRLARRLLCFIAGGFVGALEMRGRIPTSTQLPASRAVELRRSVGNVLISMVPTARCSPSDCSARCTGRTKLISTGIYGLPLRCKGVFAGDCRIGLRKYIRLLDAPVDASPDDNSLAGSS